VAALGQWGRGTVDVGQWTALSRWGKWGEIWIAEIWEMVYHPLFHLHLQPLLFFLFFFKKKNILKKLTWTEPRQQSRSLVITLSLSLYIYIYDFKKKKGIYIYISNG
jgi:hypothetical protein